MPTDPTSNNAVIAAITPSAPGPTAAPVASADAPDGSASLFTPNEMTAAVAGASFLGGLLKFGAYGLAAGLAVGWIDRRYVRRHRGDK